MYLSNLVLILRSLSEVTNKQMHGLDNCLKDWGNIGSDQDLLGSGLVQF